MKLTVLFLYLSVVNVSATVYSQGTRFNFDLKDVPVKEVFTEIEKRSNFKFLYRNDLINVSRRVDIKATDEPIESVLNRLFEKTEVTYKVFEDNLVVVTSKSTQLHKVSGKVSDARTGEGIPGVNILVEGTSSGVVTNQDGRYAIDLPDGNATLVFSYIGYGTEKVPVSGRPVIDVAMTADVKSLGEVVVVGYGTQGRADVTASVSKITKENIEKVTVSSIDQVLAGQSAGVQVNQVTGTPGGGATIRIRGSGSIGAGDDPLYVIDGFTNTYNKYSNPLSMLNPDDIESITVLKDASSTSIYGSRGANGVILITTKSAKAGVSSIEASAYYGLQEIPQRQLPEMMNAEEFARWRVEHRQDLARFQGREFDPNTIPEEYRDPQSLGAGTDWYRELTRVAPMQNYNLTVTKGSESLRSVFSGGYLNQEGTVLNTGFQRFSVRTNLDANLGKRVKVGLNLAPTYTIRKLAETEGHFNDGVLTQGTLSSPLPPVWQPDGTYTPTVTSTDAFANANPVNLVMNTRNQATQVRTLANTYIGIQLIKGLELRSTFNVDWSNEKLNFFRPSTVGGFRSPPPQPATGRYASGSLLNWLNENTLTYNRDFADHRLSVVAGYSIQKERGETGTLIGNQYASDDIGTLNAAAQVTAQHTVEEWSLLSYLSRVTYAYKDKYLLNGTVRVDGSSRFGSNNRWGTFPSASLGWRVSQESFFPQNRYLTDVKFRVSYGLSGNNAIGNYRALPTVGIDNYAFGPALAPGRSPGALASYDLGWETSRQFDAGFDIALFNGRASLVADYYTRNTQQMLQSVDIPSASGFTSAWTNLGNVVNKGFEFSLTTRNLEGKFKWETDFNISFNRNKVLDIGERVNIQSGGSNITQVGQPMGMFYGYDFLGIFQSQEEINDSPHFTGQVPGTVRYRDVNEDGVIDNKDMTVIGNPYPDFFYGLVNKFSYKNFDLFVLINGSQGGQVLDLYKRFSTNLDGVFNVSKDVQDRWRSPEQPGNGKLPTTVANTALAREVNSLWVQDASYLSVRNINLGYNLKTRFISNVRLYLSVQNAFLFTPYEGNPEIGNNGNNSLAPGINYTGYPVPRIYTVGTNLKF